MSYPIKEPHTRRSMTYRNIRDTALVHAEGKGIYSVNGVGVVIYTAERTKTLIPWHRVQEFTYDAQDTDMQVKMSKL